MKFLYDNFLQFYLLALTSIIQHFTKIFLVNFFDLLVVSFVLFTTGFNLSKLTFLISLFSSWFLQILYIFLILSFFNIDFLAL
ncbi:hypothetical protein [Spiroplasma endosymbiont of Nomada rufipes]|uniref:hypothetical protein n=1 Tax=Spiroplasma endosymbiont of Nomada rufipes TaxID=3077933 RepID=UPI00376F2018